jgi:hypothetical protein
LLVWYQSQFLIVPANLTLDMLDTRQACWLIECRVDREKEIISLSVCLEPRQLLHRL